MFEDFKVKVAAPQEKVLYRWAAAVANKHPVNHNAVMEIK